MCGLNGKIASLLQRRCKQTQSFEEIVLRFYLSKLSQAVSIKTEVISIDNNEEKCINDKLTHIVVVTDKPCSHGNTHYISLKLN